MKTFARKIVNCSVDEFKNEKRAVIKLCMGTPHINIVFVLRLDVLPSQRCFIDMELCDYNLETYMKRLWEPTDLESRFLGAKNDCAIDPILRLKYIWIIMRDIASGVSYIHQNHEIHRDLNPKNSI